MYSPGAVGMILRVFGLPKNDLIWGSPLQLNLGRWEKASHPKIANK